MTNPQNPFDAPAAPPTPALPAWPAWPAWPQTSSPSGYYQPPSASPDAPPASLTTAQVWAPPPSYAPMDRPQPAVRLANPKIRLLAWAINLVLVVVTFGIGYLIWTMILWRSSTNPGKQMLGLKVVHADTGIDATWGHLAVRDLLMPLTLGWFPYLGQVLLVVDGLFVLGPRNQRLIDRWARTLVVTA